MLSGCNLRDMHILLIFYMDNRQDNWLEETVKTHACSIFTGCRKPNESRVQRLIYHRPSDICQDQSFLQGGFIWGGEEEWEPRVYSTENMEIRISQLNTVQFGLLHYQPYTEILLHLRIKRLS